MKAVFRVDASLRIGTGHVMRCLTLAKELRDRGAKCTFICREHEGHWVERIRQEGFNCIALGRITEVHETDDADEPVLAHADWLGASWHLDAQQTIQALGTEIIDWLVVDHYGLDKRWEDMLRPHAEKIMVIDDLADRHHVCDLLLDQNLVANFEARYQDLLPENCATLLGPQYALLQPEYAELHPRTPPRMGPVQRILIFFGGVDQHNLTGRAVAAFLRLKRDDIRLDVVVSSDCPHAAAIQELTQLHANIILHDALPSLAPLMLQADLAIGAGGATSWERCCLGLPSLVITLAENQKSIAAKLDKLSLVRWLGHYDAVTDDRLVDALQAVINEETLKNWSQACMTVTCGGGTRRVASVLSLNYETKLEARLARLDDENMLLRWANDPLVRANAFNPEEITAETHQNWFYMRLRDSEHCKIYILETQDGLPIGQVRFELTSDGWTIDYSIDRFARGLGLGKRLIETALSEFQAAQRHLIVFARVKESNAPSLSIFDSLGFEKDAGGGNLSIAICSDRTSWINPSITSLLVEWLAKGYQCIWTHDADQLEHADIVFYLGYSKIVEHETRARFRNNLVVHESDLPQGKGWSPLSWQILEGKNQIPVTLIEADERVDSGVVYAQKWIVFEGHELVDELRVAQAEMTHQLCRWFVDAYPESLAQANPQAGQESFYPRRRSKDSQLDPNKTLKEQFNLLRIVDNERYPAFFELRNHLYQVSIKALK